MSSIAIAAPTNINGIWDSVSANVQNSASLEDAAKALLDGVHAQFGDALALARVFVTIPYGELPEANQAFVSSLAQDKGIADQLDANTPVLSLVGTCGEQDAWNDIRKSEGHIGIPLASAEFIDAVPMLAHLLNDLAFADVAKSSDVKTCYVADAATTRDVQNRHIVPAQDFVADHGVHTVFATGGSYGSGTNSLFACLLFTKEDVPKETAQQFEALAEKFRDATKSLRTSNAIFNA